MLTVRSASPEDLDLSNPVIRSHYGNGFVKQYVRDHLCLRTEPATNNVTDYGVKKAVENLPQLREKLAAICDNYLTVQQDILETFVDRGQLRKLTEPTVLPSGKRIPGLELDHPRQLALMHALVRFAHIAAGSTFTTAELYPYVLAALQMSADQYSLASLRYDLWKLSAKSLVEKLPKSRRKVCRVVLNRRNRDGLATAAFQWLKAILRAFNREKVSLNRWKECRAAFFLLLMAYGSAFNSATSRLGSGL